MIKATKAKESRKRDRKQNLVMLHVGDWKLYISREEAISLGKEIIKVLNRR